VDPFNRSPWTLSWEALLYHNVSIHQWSIFTEETYLRWTSFEILALWLPVQILFRRRFKPGQRKLQQLWVICVCECEVITPFQFDWELVKSLKQCPLFFLLPNFLLRLGLLLLLVKTRSLFLRTFSSTKNRHFWP